MPAEKLQAGIGIQRNPGVTMLWTSTYSTFRPYHGGSGILFAFEEPTAVEWWARGSPATRVEVVESVDSGFPLLLEQAQLQGVEAIKALIAMRADFARFLPET